MGFAMSVWRFYTDGLTKESPYWWIHEISFIQTKIVSLWRTALRDRKHPKRTHTQKSTAHKAAKQEFRSTINRSKVWFWKELCDDVDNDFWRMGNTLLIQMLEKVLETLMHT